MLVDGLVTVTFTVFVFLLGGCGSATVFSAPLLVGGFVTVASAVFDEPEPAGPDTGSPICLACSGVITLTLMDLSPAGTE